MSLMRHKDLDWATYILTREATLHGYGDFRSRPLTKSGMVSILDKWGFDTGRHDPEVLWDQQLWRWKWPRLKQELERTKYEPEALAVTVQRHVWSILNSSLARTG